MKKQLLFILMILLPMVANAHAERRELLLQFLIVSSNSPIVRNKNLKVDIHPICPILVISFFSP